MDNGPTSICFIIHFGDDGISKRTQAIANVCNVRPERAANDDGEEKWEREKNKNTIIIILR